MRTRTLSSLPHVHTGIPSAMLVANIVVIEMWCWPPYLTMVWRYDMHTFRFVTIMTLFLRQWAIVDRRYAMQATGCGVTVVCKRLPSSATLARFVSSCNTLLLRKRTQAATLAQTEAKAATLNRFALLPRAWRICVASSTPSCVFLLAVRIEMRMCKPGDSAMFSLCFELLSI